MSADELGELAERMDQADFATLTVAYLRKSLPDLQWACVQAHVSEGVPDAMIPIIPSPVRPSPKPRRPARP